METARDSAVTDDESVVDISEQVNRPADIAVQQQRIPAWHPILDPEWMIYSFLILAVIMIPLGYHMETESDKVVELSAVYDSTDPSQQLCGIGMNYNANVNCTLKFTVPSTMEPPVLIYYELTNFHQNYRAYVSSRDDFQLTGQVGNQDKISAELCEPINKIGNITINPCGLIANTFFNDKFTLLDGAVDDQGLNLTMVEEGIAWTSDLEYRFKMPNGFQKQECPEDGCDASCCTDLGWSCREPAIGKDGLCYAYDYPEDDTTQYLYETYPNIISPLEHVTNEHFVVWMRVATRPKFRKLYGYIEQTIPAGTELEFEINANYVVESFGGSKSIIISTNSMWGGKDRFVGITIYAMGYFCLACGVFFALKHWFKPRKIADRKYLHYKEE
ncbi:CDC50/LEM3 family protein [Nitzschia inconspicua]|uniref:CDC50/LEM3 family protein n=1 Tax=Nitzschia inconspicua TaxID=303405 RepID=A0A9K3PSD1_9STRA|nr:CDC50/LEM3 family protein [Nitzschia inconspicua]